MQSAKPVITCRDSGGPLEFVVDGVTGFVTDPAPEAIAEKIDALYLNMNMAKKLGLSAQEEYWSLGLSWEKVVNRLLETKAVA
jgi:glycosyltransferase involved in cell wall biosynthesis